MVEPRGGYILKMHGEDMYTGGLLNDFSDADIVGLLFCPHPVMVECGREDGVINFDAMRQEFGRARAVYEQMGVADRMELGDFDGVHETSEKGLEFLAQHLLGE